MRGAPLPVHRMLRLAAGRIKASPFSADALHKARTEIANLLSDPELALQVPERQPFFLHLISQSLHCLGDPDHEVLSVGHESFAEGVPISWGAPLPRTPQVFRPRLKQRQLDVTPFEPIMQNYASAEISSEQLEQQFRSDEQKGMMVCATEAEAKRVYGEDGVLIAAMGAVAKSNGDVRPLHDGAHGVGLNNKIVVPGRLEVPGPAEIKEAVALAQESREAVFGISADISQAHRRVRVRKCDWGRLGCKSSSSSRVLWLNTVGTFGVSSAAYWWT